MTELPPPAAGSRLAKVSIISGLLSPFTLCVGSLAGVVLGCVAIVRNRRSGGDKRTEKLAVTGILASVICMPLGLLKLLEAIARWKNQPPAG